MTRVLLRARRCAGAVLLLGLFGPGGGVALAAQQRDAAPVPGSATEAPAVAPPVAPAVTVSPAPDRVAVTIYRDPERGVDSPMARAAGDWVHRGYALITETRRVRLRTGANVIRFEGVAGGMLPESAIVRGLPAAAREKNLDADLLAPRTLYARMLGRPVTIRRTDPRTGAVTEAAAVIRSGPDGAAVIQTSEGFQAVDCGPMFETPVYAEVPPGLSAKPTLSVAVDSPGAVDAELQLSYLAWGFDWQADYVVDLDARGEKGELIAWVTLASSDPTSFRDAEMGVIAGKVNREDSAPYSRDREAPLTFRCFYRPPPDLPALPAPPAPPAPMAMAAPQSIVVTASRVRAVEVQREVLGDLQYYRMPVPTTVAAQAQKQVAMVRKPAVKVALLYTLDAPAGAPDAAPIRHVVRLRNRREDGLGLPLPGGRVAVFSPAAGTRLLLGEGGMADKADGETADVVIGDAGAIRLDDDMAARTRGGTAARHRLTVRNAAAHPVLFEAKLRTGAGERIEGPSTKLGSKDGAALWRVTVPANGVARLDYRLVAPD